MSTGGSSERLDALAQEFVDRARRGEAPSIEAYAAEHPDLAEDIRALFPVLAVVEGLKEGSAAGDPPPARRRRSMPTRVGSYRVVREIGRGGMGRVFEGVADGEPEDGRPHRLAVKVVHSHLLDRPDYIARFLREASAGRRLDHPGVVRTYGSGLLDLDGEEVPYLFLEYVEGQDLRALLKEVEVVPERLCRHVGACLARALGAIHEAGLVHRDLKPENVVITADETVKLMDLGVAVVQEEAQRLTGTGEFVGSLLYAAPGQIEGRTPEPAWDLYALGILLHELATGRHPAGARRLPWIRAVASGRAGPADSLAPGRVSPFLAALIGALLSPEPDEELATAAAVSDVLESGEGSSWWRARRDRATTPAARLARLERTTGFYGREPEWTALDRAFEAASTGEGNMVLVEGELGIGKTRLVHEWAAAQGGTLTAPRVLLATHRPGGRATEGDLLATALGEVLGERDLESRLVDLLGSRAGLAGALAQRVRGESDPRASEEVSLDAAYLAVLRALSRERPIVLLVEDLHNASEEDVDRVQFLARGIAQHAVLLVGTMRPGRDEETWREVARLDHVSRIRLGGLDGEACRRLILETVEGTSQLGESVTGLAERSDGNPLYLLELARDRAARPRETLATDTEVPDSIRGLLAGRLVGLDDADRELLQAAACQGYEFDPVVVAEAADVGRIRALKRFGRLERHARLLRPAGRLYVFQHHLLRELLYDELHPALRESFHAGLGRALEARSERPDGARAALLAEHYLKGADPDAARPHLQPALEYLEWERADYPGAEDLADRALTVPGLATGGARALALQIRGRQDVAGGRYDAALPTLEESLRYAREADSAHLEIDVLHRLSWLERRQGHLDRAVAHLEASAARAVGAGLHDRAAVAFGRVAVAYLNVGRHEEAEAHVNRAVDALRDDADDSARVRVLIDLATVTARLGRIEEAKAHVATAEHLAHEIGDLSGEFLLAGERGFLAVRDGRFQDAHDAARRGLDLGRQLGMAHTDVYLLLNAARCLGRLGRHDEALSRAAEVRRIAEARPGEAQLCLTMATQGSACVAVGRLAEGLAALRDAEAEAERLGRPNFFLGVALARADALGLVGDHAEAEAALARAEARFGPSGPGPALGDLAAVRARGAWRRARFAECRAGCEEAIERASGHGRQPRAHALLHARSLLGEGREADAAAALATAVEWANHSGEVAHGLLAQVWQAHLPGGDPLAARVALEMRERFLAHAERVEAHFALWRATGDRADLKAAWDRLETLVAAAPAADREAMQTEVALHRRVREAWLGAPAS